MGFAAAHTVFAVDQSTETRDQPARAEGGSKPASRQGMRMVLRLSCHVGGQGGKGPKDAVQSEIAASAKTRRGRIFGYYYPNTTVVLVVVVVLLVLLLVVLA
jgi:hypothetical protein